jgi:hypothetical protein
VLAIYLANFLAPGLLRRIAGIASSEIIQARLIASSAVRCCKVRSTSQAPVRVCHATSMYLKYQEFNESCALPEPAEPSCYASCCRAIRVVWSALLPMMDSGAKGHCTHGEVSCTLESPHRGTTEITGPRGASWQH